MSATVIYLSDIVSAATESAMGVVSVDTTNGLTISDGRLGTRLASVAKAGTVRPDGTTIMVDDSGIISTNDYGTLISDLARRVEELEEALAREVMTYDNGTLIVNSTYDDGTLVTNQGYDDGTLF